MTDTASDAYKGVERKIAPALREQSVSLDLSGNELGELTDLPESPAQLTQLRSLDLRGNQLSALPEWLQQLTALNELSATTDCIPPEWLQQFTELNELYLSNNRLRTAGVTAVHGIERTLSQQQPTAYRRSG